jgi:hypothetical protein
MRAAQAAQQRASDFVIVATILGPKAAAVRVPQVPVLLPQVPVLRFG